MYPCVNPSRNSRSETRKHCKTGADCAAFPKRGRRKVTWIIIVASVLFLLGTVLMVQPNAHQNRLSKLRNTAMQQGLKVRVALTQSVYPKLQKTGYCGYSLAREEPVEDLKGYFLLLTKSTTDLSTGQISESVELEWVDIEGCFRAARDEVRAVLAPLVEADGLTILGGYATANDVTLVWNEQGDEQSVQRLKSALEQLLNFQKMPT